VSDAYHSTSVRRSPADPNSEDAYESVPQRVVGDNPPTMLPALGKLREVAY
jgi:hypothetical protein